jgi:hypothetical protein
MDYSQARNLLNTARNRANGKPIENNTRIFDRGDYLAIQLHRTDIIRFYPDGRITIHPGRWYSPTTKDRINRYTDARIYQRNFTWYLGDGRIFTEGVEVGKRQEAPVDPLFA